MGREMRYVSPIGEIVLEEENGKLVRTCFVTEDFDADDPDKMREQLIQANIDQENRGLPPVLCEAKAWLDAYFAGKKPAVPLKLNPFGTPFAQRVYDIVRTIPEGQTMSYKEIAQILAKENESGKMSPQAIGGALRRNRLLLFIPCHRVVGADDSLTGYAGGMQRKAWLLEHERKLSKAKENS